MLLERELSEHTCRHGHLLVLIHVACLLLVLHALQGWEYTVLERELGAHRDPLRKMLVTVIEFESHAMMIGHLGLRVSLIAYPVVSVKKASALSRGSRACSVAICYWACQEPPRAGVMTTAGCSCPILHAVSPSQWPLPGLLATILACTVLI